MIQPSEDITAMEVEVLRPSISNEEWIQEILNRKRRIVIAPPLNLKAVSKLIIREKTKQAKRQTRLKKNEKGNAMAETAIPPMEKNVQDISVTHFQFLKANLGPISKRGNIDFLYFASKNAKEMLEKDGKVKSKL